MQDSTINEHVRRRQEERRIEAEQKLQRISTLNEVGQKVHPTSMTKQVIGGVFDAGNEVLQLIDEMSIGIADKLGVPELAKPLPGLPEDAKINFPNIEPPNTTAQSIARKMTQFVTGFIGAGKFLKPIQTTSKAGQTMKIAGQGAIADFAVFDPHEERLSNLLDEHPELKNPVTDFLRADPTDTAAEGRLKNTLEGLGIGTAIDIFVKGVKGVRSVALAKKGQGVKSILDQQVEMYGKLDDEAFGPLGSLQKPAFLKDSEFQSMEQMAYSRKAKSAKAGKATALPKSEMKKVAEGLSRLKNPGGEDVYINFARIDSTDDVKAIMGNMADAFAKDIDEARRGVMTQNETVRLAESLGMTVEDLMARRKGQAFNAEQAVAARQLWAASSEKLLELAKKASDANAGDADRFMFRKQLATHHAIQQEVIAARTETARSLASWKIPTGSTERARAVQDVLMAHGGSEVTAEMAKRLALLADAPPGALASFIEKSATARTLDAVKESFVLGLLWSPKTHLRNITGNTVVMMQQIYERAGAEKVSQLLGREAGKGVAPGEAGAMYFGLRNGIRDAFKYAYKSLKTGETGQALGKIDIGHDKAISAQALAIKHENLGKVADVIGETIRLPGRALSAQDEFFKTIGYRMELSAQAYRQAYSEGLEKNTKAFTDRVADLMENPPENIRISAADAALYNTFTNRTGEWGQSLMNLRNSTNIGFVPLGTMVLPFVRTPVNIMRYVLERSPLAPIVGQWREDIAAGGARADIAMSRMATGSALMFTIGDLASTGQITGKGPDDPGEREAMLRQGWQPYSAKIGDKYYSFQSNDPIGMMFGFGADIQQMMNRYEIEPEEMDEVNEIVASIIGTLASTVYDKSAMTGIARILSAFEDPERYGPSAVSDTLESSLPMISAFGAVESLISPEVSETFGMLDYIQARIPGLSSRLTVKRDLWGRSIADNVPFGATYDTLSPVRVKEIEDSPIDKEMVRLNTDFRRIRKKTSFEGVNINFAKFPKVYEQYVIRSGQAAKEYLDAVVSGNHKDSEYYNLQSDGEKGGKAAFIGKAISRFRKQVREEIMKDPQYAEFQQYVRDQKQKKKAALQGMDDLSE